MKTRSRILSFMLACVFAMSCLSFAVTSVSADSEAVLFEEGFESSDFASQTSNSGKAGAWTVTGTQPAYDATAKTIYVRNSSNAWGQWDFNFTDEYEGTKTLKVESEILAGAADSSLTLTVFSDTGWLPLCTIAGGNIYANATNATEGAKSDGAYNTGISSCVYPKVYKITGLIDEASETFLLSVYNQTDSVSVLDSQSFPFKSAHDSYAKMTSGFKGMRVHAERAQGQKSFEVYNFSVKEILTPWTVAQSDITLTSASGDTQSWDSVTTDLATAAIDFGVAMNELTLTTSNVYIENASTGTKVSYTGSYSNNIYTMTMGEELDSNSTYNIVITSAVATSAGAVNAENSVYSFSTIASINDENVLFEESFESSDFASQTSNSGKAGAWTVTGTQPAYDATAKTIYVRNASNAWGQWDFNFTDEYEGVKKLKVEADILGGAAESTLTITAFSDTGWLPLFTIAGGNVYANATNATEGAKSDGAYNTGISCTSGNQYTITGTIDEANEIFVLSVYDKTNSVVLLENQSFPFKSAHDSYAKMTSGFKGVRVRAERASGKKSFEVYNISVKELPIPWTVTESDITLANVAGDAQSWDSVNNLSTVSIDFGKAMDVLTLTANNVYIENAATGTRISYTGSYSENVYTMTLQGSADSDSTYNIVITSDVATADGATNAENCVYSFTTSSPESDATVLFEEDFSSSSYASNTSYGERTGAWSGATPNYSNEDSGIIYPARNNSINLWFKFDNGYENVMSLEAVARVRAGDTASGNESRIDLFGALDPDNAVTLCMFKGGYIYANTIAEDETYKTGGTYVAGHIYTVTGKINQVSKTFSLSVYDETAQTSVVNNFSVPYRHKKDSYAEMSGLKGIRFYSVRGNVSDEYSLSALTISRLPVSWTVTESNITLSDINGIVQSLTDASILTNEIAINFGVAMNESSLNGENIYLEKDSDGSKIAYTGTYSEGVYTMTLSGSLVSDEQYNIVIGSAVKTADNAGNDSNTVISFTTAAGSAVDEDYSYDRSFTFDNLDGWTKTGIQDTAVSGGQLTAPTSSTGERIARYNYDPVYEKPINLEISYDIYPGANTSTRVQLGGDTGYIVLANFNAGTIFANTYSTENTTGVAYTAGELYKVRCFVDQINETLHIWVYDNNNTVIVDDYKDAPFGGNNGRGASIVGLQYLQITNNVAETGGEAVKLDNLVITEVLPAPTVSASSISIGVLGGEVFDNFASVDPIANTITLDFGTPLDTSTLTAGSIRVLQGATPLDTTLSYGNRLVTLIINDALLANTTYTISVAGTIENKSGVLIGDSFEIDFTTGAASKSAVIGKCFVDGSEVTDLAQILTGDSMVVEVDYKNSTRENQTLYLIVASFNGYYLKHAAYITRPVDASVTKSTIAITCPDVVKGDDVDKIKVMLWDGFDGAHMHPLSPCKTFR